jgi:hypothetical protein
MDSEKDQVGVIRQFSSGATRDTEAGKLDFEGFMSPIVIQAYAKYLNKHRIQSDGKVRDSDNWQKLFGEKHLDVCIKSGFRHFFAWWMLHRGFDAGTDKGQPITVDDALGGLIFNAMAYWFKILKERTEPCDCAQYEVGTVKREPLPVMKLCGHASTAVCGCK